MIAILRSDPEWHVRSYAAQALGAIGDAAGATALREACAKDPEVNVRREAKKALKRIEGLTAGNG